MISIETGEHYNWGAGCDGWHLAKSEGLSVIQESMPPGTSEVRHFHTVSRQFFFVLKGVLTIEIEGRHEILQTHQGLEVSPRDRHQVLNQSAGETQFLAISQPPIHGDRVVAGENPK